LTISVLQGGEETRSREWEKRRYKKENFGNLDKEGRRNTRSPGSSTSRVEFAGQKGRKIMVSNAELRARREPKIRESK